MTSRLALIPFLLSPAILAQDSTSRSKAAEYPVHATLPNMEVGAEYLVHSIPRDNGFYIAKDYLVVEAGVFPATKDGIDIAASQFTLLVNGKTVLYTVSPGMVTASLKYPDWEQHRNMTVEGGNGNAAVIVGAPPAVGRFPGDQRGSVPINRPKVSETENAQVAGKSERPIDEAIAIAALPEGPAYKLVHGCLFFSFQGKTKSIHSLALVYDGGAGPKTTIPLF
jgi:hypothetical protein